MAEQTGALALGAHEMGPDLPTAPARAGFRRPAWLRRAMPGTVPLLCLQAALFAAFSTGRLDLREFAGIHLVQCAAAAIIGRWWIDMPSAVLDRRSKTAIALQLVGWTAVAGPYGTALAAALTVPRRAQDDARIAPGPLAADAGFTRLHEMHGLLLDNRLRIQDLQGTRPLLDIMIDGTQIQKFDALSLISKHYHPALATTLRRALADKDGSVRVLAATVVAKRHDAYTKRIGALQDAARSAPGHPGPWHDLAHAHLAYAESGLLEPARAKAEAGQALDCFVQAASPGFTADLSGNPIDAARRMAAAVERTSSPMADVGGGNDPVVPDVR